MVVASRSSLRRSNLRGHDPSSSPSPSSNPPHPTAESKDTKIINDARLSSRSLPRSQPQPQPPPLLAQSRDAGNSLPSKRLRASTVTEKDQIYKRRRLSDNNNDIPHLRIPLRSRVATSKIPSAAPIAILPQPDVSTFSSTTSTPIASPSGKPQYEQIKIIEAKAKAAIRKNPVAAIKDEKRKLRSEDGGSRAKTELAQYFPEFEEMLSLKQADPGM